VVSGVLGLSYGLAGFFPTSAVEPNDGTSIAAVPLILAAVLGIAAYYVVLHRVLGERLFARANPWFGTTIALGSLGVFTAPFMPEPVQRGVGLYVGAALILTAFIGYGGCEVVALPTLLFRRRYVLYCPLNAVDAPERSFHHLRMDTVARLAAASTMIVGAYFLLGRDILAFLGMPDPIAPSLALLLLAPAALSPTGHCGHARGGRPRTPAPYRCSGLARWSWRPSPCTSLS
jgi:hypothetical protein